MASIRRHGKAWRAEVYRHGKRRSKVLPTRREAQDWAARTEYLMGEGDTASSQPFRDVLDRYAREVAQAKRGARWEIIRIERFKDDDLAQVRMCDLTATDLALWRDRRLREVAPGTVRREMTLLSAVLEMARREWRLIPGNPMRDVRKPPEPAPRDRLPTSDEFERLEMAAGDDLTNATARAYHAFLFACETAMRAGEIVGLTWDRVDLSARVATLPMTKNGRARDVPLSSEAVRLLEAMPRCDPVFGLTSRQLDALWRKLRDRAGVEGLTFHDSRHCAITRLSGKLDVMALARMVGHRNISQLLTYFNEGASDLAKRLD